ncbi:hypothetical protein GGI43DRAFT_428561 [Trichoderma evansii]
MCLSKTSIQFSCFFFIAAVQAYKTFEPECSTPPADVNYVASPNSRGTLNILWSSLLTIFACTWTIHHPNVPRQYHGYRHNWSWALRGFLKSTGRMVLTIFAPEIIIAVAYNEFLAARVDHKSLVSQAKEDEINWSWTHTYYANMGGFVIEKNDYEHWVRGEYNMHHLSGRDILILRKKRYIEKLPNITERELKDRVKSDSLVKAISIIQIIWSAAQILVRTVRRLSICPLELTVLAFALCAIAIYLLYWYKPKSIGISTTIIRKKLYSEIQDILKQARVTGVDITQTEKSDNPVNESAETKTLKAYTMANLLLPGSSLLEEGAPMRIDAIRKGPEFDDSIFWTLFVGMVLFGAIHIGAWNFEFPTKTELYLWRYSAIYSTSSAFIAAVVVFLRRAATKHLGKLNILSALLFYCGIVLSLASSLLYVPTRLFFLVEMLRTLCFLPPKSYTSTW